jgi:2,4-dienoyl-CoA reductase (NADPH2)
VTLFEAAREIGGQFNMAKRIPGKEEFCETLAYYRRQLELLEVELKLDTVAGPAELGRFDEVILATGVIPRTPEIEGLDHPRVLSYLDVLQRDVPVGAKVAIIGAGGIGFDVAEFLGHPPHDPSELPRPDQFARQWGIDMTLSARGGVEGVKAQPEPLAREIWLLQRKTSKPGKGLGKTTGWVHRLSLRQRGVKMLAGVEYRSIDDRGLHIRHDGRDKLLEVDNVVVCAGQLPRRELYDALRQEGMPVHLIGGADVAAELDAKRAIRQGAELAARI